MCQAAWFQLINIRSVRSSLTKEATLRLACMASRVGHKSHILRVPEPRLRVPEPRLRVPEPRLHVVEFGYA